MGQVREGRVEMISGDRGLEVSGEQTFLESERKVKTRTKQAD